VGDEARQPVKLYMLRRLIRFAESVAATEMHDLIRNLAEFKQINEE